MKKYLLLATILLISPVYSQKVVTRTGEIKFEASVPAFEEIAAQNKTVSSIFDQDKSELVALVLIKAFRFKIPLMEEHFNENYMESNQFPKATFKGKLKDFNPAKVTSKVSSYMCEGELTIHGVKKTITTKIDVFKVGKKIDLSSVFFINPQDYSVEIPSLVKNKISDKVKISLHFQLE